MARLQTKKLTFTLVTKGDEPLEIDDHTMALIADKLDTACQQLVDLRYGSKYDEKRHDYVGVTLP